MKLLNTFVGAILIASFLWLATRSPAPPENDWFQAVVVDQPRPVLVKFGAEWCPPCQQMEQMLDDLPTSVTSQVKIVRIDIDEHPDLADHYGISSIPRVYLFDKGQVLAKTGGFGRLKDLEKWVLSRL